MSKTVFSCYVFCFHSFLIGKPTRFFYYFFPIRDTQPSPADAAAGQARAAALIAQVIPAIYGKTGGLLKVSALGKFG